MFPSVRIGEVATIKGGKRLPKGDTFSIEPTDHPYIRAQDIRNGKIKSDDLVYITDAQHLKVKNYIANKGDVCITIVGANVGEVGIVPKELDGANLTENAVKLVNLKDLDQFFLFYSLLHHRPQEQMKLLAGGAAQPKLGIYKVAQVEIPYPPLPIQHKIADVLSAYDDLIEVNTRRIRILEQMAQSVYREWFGRVDVQSLPRGWEVVKLGDACNIVMGQSPASEFYNEEGKGLPFHQGVTNFGDRYPTDKVFCTVENRIAEKGDILFSVRAPVGRLNISTKKIVIGRGLSAIRSKTGNQSFVFQQLKEQFHEDDMMGGGTIFKSVTKDDVLGIKFLMPPKELIAKFENFANPISHELEILTAKNANLRRTRDLLLPRLVSGEVSAEGMEG